jgi:hypothetical protein
MVWLKALSGIVGLAGIIFFAQGTGLFTSYPSGMNNDLRWAVIGVVMFIVALLIWPRKIS